MFHAEGGDSSTLLTTRAGTPKATWNGGMSCESVRIIAEGGAGMDAKFGLKQNKAENMGFLEWGTGQGLRH